MAGLPERLIALARAPIARGRVAPTLNRRARIVAGAGAAALAALLAVDLALPPPLARAAQTSPVVEDRDGVWLRGFTTPEGRWRLAADLKRTDAAFLRALVEVEDARFWIHPGVDPLAVARASASAVARGAVTSGASTLTMQLARLIEPRPRTIPSKLVEMLRALQIERRLRKRDILALYLTAAPYGGNLEGVRAASRAYFDKDPAWLTDEETALLIALPQAPEARRPDRRPEAAVAARNRILARLAARGLIPEQRAQEASASPAPPRRPFPVSADHAAARLAAVYRDRGVIVTTLDASMQAEAEAIAARAAIDLEPHAGLAILVADAETREVRALVGGAGRDRPGGWIDMTRAVRSPGSTLKPFIYAIAFDDGVAAPETLAADAPRTFAGYLPENFDRRFHGDVRLYEALQHSLNVPAVATLEQIGAARFADTLRLAYAPPRLPRRHEEEPGLALALGGVGMTLEQLVTLYAALGDDGSARPLRLADPIAAPRRRFLRAETAERVRAILATSPSPAGRAPAHLATDAPQVAFKTGTSYGFRDAWALGVSGGLAVGVWVGRPDGAPRPGATGRSAALPILFEVMDALAARDGAVVAPDAPAAPAPGLARLPDQRDGGPMILFPPNDAELLVLDYGPQSRGLSLSARGGRGGLVWYADGVETPREEASGRALWRPSGPGFYTVTVVDAAGRSDQVRVRVRDR